LRDVIRWAAQNKMGFEIHWNPQRTVGKLLDIMEETNKEFPITDLRWAINHLHDASADSLKRMKALGVGWSVQDSLYFSGAQFKKVFGVDIAERSPPIKTALDLGVMVGGHRRSSRVVLQSLRFAALVSRRQKHRRGRERRPERASHARAGAAHVHHEQRVVCPRRDEARLAGAGQIRRPRGADEGLHERAGRRDRRHRVVAHHAWRYFAIGVQTTDSSST
jgi:hypothetical protein